MKTNRIRESFKMLPKEEQDLLMLRFWRGYTLETCAKRINSSKNSVKRTLVRILRKLHVKHNRRGTAAVEFALIAPVFFLLVFGAIFTGRIIMVHHQISTAASVGARAATFDGATLETIKQAIVNEKGNLLLSVRNYMVEVAFIKKGDDEFGVVTVSCDLSDNSWLPIKLGYKLSATHSMRREAIY